MKIQSLILSILISFCLIPSVAWSAKVQKVKGTSVLINLENSDIKTGALYYLVLNGKKKAIIKVLKQRPGQAIGKLLKGKAKPGLKLVRRPSKKKRRKSIAKPSTEKLPPLKSISDNNNDTKKSKSYSSGDGSFKSKLGIGGVLGFSQNSDSVKGSNGTTAGSGSSTGLDLIADYKYSNKLSFRVSAGQQHFSSEDGAAIIDLTYISLDAWARYHFGSMYWAGGGAAVLLSPDYGQTNAVLESDLGSQFFLQLGGGLDYRINEKFYIPVWAEYGTTLASGDATLNAITIKAGIALKL